MIASVILFICSCACSLITVDFQVTSYKFTEPPPAKKVALTQRTVCVIPSELPTFSGECAARLLSVVDSTDELVRRDVMTFVASADQRLTRFRDEIFDYFFFDYWKSVEDESWRLVCEGGREAEDIVGGIPESLTRFRKQFAGIICAFLLPTVQARIQGWRGDCWGADPRSLCTEELHRYPHMVHSVVETISIIRDCESDLLDGRPRVIEPVATAHPHPHPPSPPEH